MNALDDEIQLVPCARHPNRPTALRCGKCGRPICVRCVVQTPVGARCGECANMRRLPQFDVGPALLARSILAGAGVSLVGWFLLSYVHYLRFFLCILVGVGVGEVMTRLALRRTNRVLDSAAVVVVVGGLLAIEMVRVGSAGEVLQAMADNFGVLTNLAVPAVVASLVAVVKLR